MDFELTKDSLASIVGIIAPGYLAIQVYSAVYSKARKDFAQMLLDSIVYGLLIVASYDAALHILGIRTDSVLSFGYYMPLLAISPLLGLTASYLRRRRPLQRLALALNLPGPDDDFLRDSFKRLPAGSVVTVTLKSGEIFSGTLDSLEVGPQIARTEQKMSFGDLAWYREHKRKSHWEARPGNLIVSAGDILYIETDLPLNK